MATKTGAQRYAASINYLSQSIDAGLALHLAQVLAAAPPVGVDDDSLDEQIGQALSLKGASTWWNSSDPSKRHALRALVLCRRVYLSALWSLWYPDAQGIGNQGGQQGGSAPADYRPDDLEKDTIKFWKAKTGGEVNDAIRMFLALPNACLNDLVVAAATGLGAKQVMANNIKLTRASRPFMGDTTCFMAVICWLVLSGITSLRWFLRANTNPANLLNLLGTGVIVVRVDQVLPLVLPTVQAGLIVNFFDPTAGTQGGHWVVSDGVGGGYGANNDDENGAKDTAYDHITLRGQLIGFRNAHSGIGGMRVIDPMQIPGRM